MRNLARNRTTAQAGSVTAALVGTVVACVAGGAVAAVTLNGLIDSQVNSTLKQPDSLSNVDEIPYGTN